MSWVAENKGPWDRLSGQRDRDAREHKRGQNIGEVETDSNRGRDIQTRLEK